MASLIELRILKSGAGLYETRPGIREAIDFTEGETLYVSPALAEAWQRAGVAEPVSPPRNAEVERATREPRSEQAVAFKRRRR